MKNLVAIVCVLCVVAAIPVPEGPKTSLDLLNIPLSNGKELDVLSITDGEGKITERNKRTIDILRQLFPTLTQLIEMKIQAVLPILIRTLGPVLLRGGLGGGSGGGASTTSSTDDFDDDDDDFGSDSGVSQNAGGRKVSVSLPMFEVGADDEDDEDLGLPSSASSTTTTTTSSSTSTTAASPVGNLFSNDDNTAQRINLPTTLDEDEDVAPPASTTTNSDTENQI